MVFERVDMDVGRAALDGFVDQAVDQADHRRVILPVEQVCSFRDIVDQALQTAPALHGGIDVIIRHRSRRKGLGQQPVIGVLVQRFQSKHAAERASCLHQRQRICALTDSHGQLLPSGQDDQSLLLGKGVCELRRGEIGRRHCGGGLPSTSVMKLSIEDVSLPSPSQSSSARI